jgi:hypothetical protein
MACGSPKKRAVSNLLALVDQRKGEKGKKVVSEEGEKGKKVVSEEGGEEAA